MCRPLFRNCSARLEKFYQCVVPPLPLSVFLVQYGLLLLCTYTYRAYCKEGGSGLCVQVQVYTGTSFQLPVYCLNMWYSTLCEVVAAYPFSSEYILSGSTFFRIRIVEYSNLDVYFSIQTFIYFFIRPPLFL